MRTHASGRRCWRPHLYGDERDKRGGKGKREEHILRSVGDLDVGKLLFLDGGVSLDLNLEDKGSERGNTSMCSDIGFISIYEKEDRTGARDSA